MTVCYLDVSAIGNEYDAYADTPTTWAKPQDGNGLAGPGHSAAVPVVELTFSMVPTTGTISVYGVNVTLTGVLGAIGLSAAAAALASSINATATATTAAVCQALLPLNRFVYARVKPTDANTVQVMCRIAGANLNYPANSSARVVNTFNMSAMTSPLDFAGGADGPWSYLANDGVVFGKAKTTYGIFCAKAPGPNEPGAADYINVRTRRSGADLTVTLNETASTLTLRTPASSVRYFLADNGTVWSGDDGQITIFLNNTYTVAAVNFGTPASAAVLVFECRKRYGARLLIRCAGGAGGYTAVVAPQGTDLMRVQGMLIEAYDAVTAIVLAPASPFSYAAMFVECRLLLRKVSALFNFNGSYDIHYRFVSTIFEWTGIGSHVTYMGSTFAPGSSGPVGLVFENCPFVVDGGAYSVTGVFQSAAGLIGTRAANVTMTGCTGLVNPSIGMPASPLNGLQKPTYSWTDEATGAFRIETPYTTVEYVPASNYPTLGVTLASGALMAYRFTWETARLNRSLHHEVGVFRTFYRSASAVRTLDIEMLTPTAEVPNTSHIGLAVTYVDSSNVVRNETSFSGTTGWIANLFSLASSLPAGVGLGAWALNGATGVESRKVTLTTVFAVKQNTEIVARLLLMGPPTGTRVIYVSPEVRVT